jgi:PmbA protein
MITYQQISSKLEETKTYVDGVISKAKKDGISQVEIYSAYSVDTELSIEKNDISTSTHSEDTNFGVRVIENHCQGFVTTNSRDTLYQSIEGARSIARSQNMPDDCVELPEPRSIHPVDGLYLTDLDTFGFEDILNSIRKIFSVRESQFPKVNIDTGSASVSKGFKFIASSTGVMCSEIRGDISASFFGMAVDGNDIGSFDYDSATGRNMAMFQKNLDHALVSFGEKCMGSLNARSIQGFRGSIILTPDTVFNFLGDLLSSMTGTMIRKKRSKFGDKLGQQVTSPLLSIFEDPLIPCFTGSTSFDREGMPTEAKEIITKGVIHQFFYNHFEAKKAGLQQSSGNASGGSSSTPGCGPKQLQILPGKSHLQDILKPTDKTILVNRFSGTSDAVSGDFSGSVKGSFLLEGGEKIPVKEVIISGNMYEVLNRITDVSRERKLLGSSSHVPWIKFADVDITGTDENC